MYLCEVLLMSRSILVFYLHANYAVPVFFIRRKYWQYFATVLALVIIFQILSNLLQPISFRYSDMLQEMNLNPGDPRPHPHRPPGTAHRYVAFFITLAASGMYSYSIENGKRERRLRELEKQQIESNLQQLKYQLSPHFLFNALNSIYSLSLKKSDELPKAILTMSELLRYVTYDSVADSVNIQKEINYLNDYIKLQKLRVSPESEIDFEIINNNASAEVVPMIFIPFVGNAFKHGVDSDGVAKIYAKIEVLSDEVDFYIENKKYVNTQKDETHGIGIQNVKSRLEILYGSKHTLDIAETDDTYKVTLKLKL